ncbi:MAG: hypothetical protein U9R07_07235 [Pseudomonadota bacterium]|nr:hypothetical protein [Pseudomonadota bacterium]
MLTVRELETQAFQGQTARTARAWAEAGNAASELTVPDADHFSILTELWQEDGVLRRAVGEWPPA